jgi:hypothetical protein
LNEYANSLSYRAYRAIRKANPGISVADANKAADALIASVIGEANDFECKLIRASKVK